MAPFFLTLNLLLFVLALPTFRSWAVLTTLVSWFQIKWLDKHISAVCHSAYRESRWIRSIRQCLTAETTKTLICAFLFFKLDYCNPLLSAHLTFSIDYRQFRTLWQNWFSKHANVIMCNLFFKFFIGPSQNRPQTVNYLSQLLLSLISCYISDFLTVNTPSRQLNFSADTWISYAHVKTKTEAVSPTELQISGIFPLLISITSSTHIPSKLH